VDLALQCDKISKIIITSDIDIPNRDRGITVDKEPSSLAGDDVPLKAVIEYIRKKYNITNPIVLLQPTCPLRSIEDINAGIFYFELYHKNIIPWDSWKRDANGVIFIVKGNDPWEQPLYFYESKNIIIDIDYEYQFKIAEQLMRNKIESNR